MECFCGCKDGGSMSIWNGSSLMEGSREIWESVGLTGLRSDVINCKMGLIEEGEDTETSVLSSGETANFASTS